MFRKDDLKSDRDLKQLAVQPTNRECFECGQRCVTYVDMTIGSFVCTRCCGILRGLDPPHRLKSLNVCKFTEGEVEFLKLRGNQVLTEYFPERSRFSDCFVRRENEEQHRSMLAHKYSHKRMESFKTEIAGKTAVEAADDKNLKLDKSSLEGQERPRNGHLNSGGSGYQENKELDGNLLPDFGKVSPSQGPQENEVADAENELEWDAFVECTQGNKEVNHDDSPLQNNSKIVSESNGTGGAELNDLFSLTDAFPIQTQPTHGGGLLWGDETLFTQVPNEDQKPSPACPIIAEDPFVGIDQQLKKSLSRPSKT